MTFEPKEHLRKIQQKDYLDTSWRIVWFKEVHPNGRIETEPFTVGNIVYMKAFIFDAENKLLATGLATVRDARQHESTWAGRIIEKAETAAIGRALAHAGFGTQFTGENDDDNLADSPKDASAGKSQQKTNQGKAQKPAQDKKSTNPDDHFGKKDNSASKTENWRDTLVILTKPLYTNEHHQKNGLNAALQNKLIGANVPMNDMLAAIFFHRCAKNWGMSIPEVVKVLGFNPLQMELTQEAVRQAWHHMKDAMSQMPE